MVGCLSQSWYMGEGLDPASIEINRLNCRPPPLPGEFTFSGNWRGWVWGGGQGQWSNCWEGKLRNFIHIHMCVKWIHFKIKMGSLMTASPYSARLPTLSTTLKKAFKLSVSQKFVCNQSKRSSFLGPSFIPFLWKHFC